MKISYLNFLIFGLVLISFFSCSNSKVAEKNQAEIINTDIVEETPLSLESFDTIKLLMPEKQYGKSLMECIWARKSDREFSDKMLSLRQLSDIMWVSYGINRPDEETRNRTVPSAMALYPFEVYVSLPNGIYFYNVTKHVLEPRVEGDFRKNTGAQSFVEQAPVNICMFVNYDIYDAKKIEISNDKKLILFSLDAAHSCQNIYLYCASEGLNTVERAMAPENINEIFNLGENYKFIVAQTIGYPKN